VGIPGGIPPRPRICTTLSPGVTSAQITTAIANCPAGQTVKLNAGTYNIAGVTFNNKSNVTLRGSGANATFLVFTSANACHGTSSDMCFDSGDSNYAGGPANTANWTAGYARGTTVLTFSSVANLHVGSLVVLDQNDDTTDTGAIFVCESPTCASSGPSGGQRRGRAQQQLVEVTAITGTQVTVTPGLYMSNWRSSQSPQAWWSSSPITGSGVEDLSLDHSAANPTAGIEFFNCLRCFVKGVRAIKPGRDHVMLFGAARAVIRDSYFYEGQSHYTQSYGIEPIPGSDSLIENNLFQAVTAPRALNGGCSGCVISYNFSINDIFGPSATWASHSDFPHAGGIDFLLIEGNVGLGVYGDNFHGSHHFITVFRNRFYGRESNNGSATTANTIPMMAMAYSRFYNFIGNVLGTVGYHTRYQASSLNDSSISIYVAGLGNQVANDPNVEPTMMRWGNYDTFNGAVRFVAAEVPSGLTGAQAPWANPVPSTQTLPASMYLSAKPAFWPAAKPWPPIGPDVTGGNIPNVAGHAYTIPAQDCFTQIGGTANGVGNVLPFDRVACGF
jgi:hypothetical protein